MPWNLPPMWQAVQSSVACAPVKREAGEFQVIEFRAEPGIGAMAGLARGREVEHFVIRFGGLLKVGHVAREAFRRQPRKLAHGFALMAVGTFQQRVGSEQREAIVMLLQLIGANVPPLDGMALGAIRAELAAVNIGVAVCTIAADVFEHQIGVALRAVTPFRACLEAGN